jgi:two-component system, NtrC family, sensor kinase
MQCPRQHENPPGQKFCGECGTPAAGAASAKPYADLKDENEGLTRSLAEALEREAEALEQQTATGEILRLISSSPTDVQPVYDSIVERAARLCEAEVSLVARLEGEWIHVGAVYGTSVAGTDAVRRTYPMRPGAAGATARAIRDSAIAHIPDVLTDREFTIRDAALVAGFRAVLAVPMLRVGRAIGAIAIGRAAAGEFSTEQVNLLRTFADQAVIAIENVRLFKALEQKNQALTESLDQQTATSEILRVIASSPGDIQPVFDAIAANAARLCDAVNGLVIRFDGELLHLAAHYNVDPERLAAVRQAYPRPPSRGALSGRATLMREVVHVPDVSQDAEYTLPAATTIGYRSVLAVPMMHEGVPRGTILVARDVVAPFSDTHIALIQTFADQAVIAIENVRLFKELQTSNRDLTTALDKQTATSDILRVISRSQTDIRPVFDTIIASAVRLLGGHTCGLTRVTGDQLELVALTSIDAAADAPVRAAFPQSLQAVGAHPQAIRDRVPLNVADAHADARLAEGERLFAGIRGFRSWVVVPMLRDDVTIGSIGVTRREAGGFTADEIALLQTFADQAVIAIENVRLFKELEAANRELAAASQHKSEFLANMSHELRTPLNAIIGFSEVLTDRMFGELNEKQEEYLKDIYASGTHLLSLINDILDLSKIEAGRMELELTDFDLPTALDNALMLVRERAQRRSLTLHKDVDAGVGQIQGDERKIRQVVLNLLSNAIKFTPEGGRIEVAAVSKDGFVEVSVSDTGVGIAPQDQEAVFQEFRQVGTAEKKAEGTGLGLTLCRKFIELHGGKIRVKSQLGVGSTFTFTIPARRSK